MSNMKIQDLDDIIQKLHNIAQDCRNTKAFNAADRLEKVAQFLPGAQMDPSFDMYNPYAGMQVQPDTYNTPVKQYANPQTDDSEQHTLTITFKAPASVTTQDMTQYIFNIEPALGVKPLQYSWKKKEK